MSELESQRAAPLKVRLESLAAMMKEREKQDDPSLGRLDAIPPPLAEIGLERGETMTVRISNVLYWSACALAFMWLPFLLLATSAEPQPQWSFAWAAGLFGAAVIWIVGRALRYILAGN